MWRTRVAVFAFLALCQSTFFSNPARAETIEISDSVWGSFQQYLMMIGSTNPGAFAVSRDGGSSYYVYCRDVRCRSGSTYSHDAINRCESMTGRECVVFALWREIQVAYTLEPKAAPAISANPQPVAVAPEEPPFESPLADGTIVLSHKVAAELEGYLAAIDRQDVAGFFYVAANGRKAGSFICEARGGGGLPLCPTRGAGYYADPKPNQAQVKQRALDKCEADAEGCVMLYSGAGKRANYKITDNPAPKKLVSSASSAPVVASEPEEPPFESPLADGTIVLSKKVAAELDRYLAAVDRQDVAGFFYVAPNGRDSGSFACDARGGVGLPLCPTRGVGYYADPKPNQAQVKQRALDSCEADADGCVMLFSGDNQRTDYQIVQ